MTRAPLLFTLLALSMAASLTVGCKDDSPDSAPDDSAAPVDADGDGFSSDEDCDDADAAVYPGADELCDGVDNDCDYFIDDDDDDVVDAVNTYYRDVDRDSYGDAASPLVACSRPVGYAVEAEDCDDDDALVYPGAPELCDDGRDNDCDGEDVACATELADAALRVDGAAGEGLGRAVDMSGDLDGDGALDLVAAGPANAFDDGAVWVWLDAPAGSETRTAEADLVIRGGFGVGFGTRVVSGDFDDDGVDDLCVSSARDGTAGAQAGALLFYYGPLEAGELTLFDFDIAVLGGDAGDQLGHSLTRLDDLDGDGDVELLFGAPYNSSFFEEGGAAYLFAGPIDVPRDVHVPELQVFGEAAGDRLGEVVADAGDLNGDGVNDLVFGAPRHDAGGEDAGVVYLLPGVPSGIIDASDVTLRVDGEAPGARVGASLTALGDYNGDGFGDLLVGAPGAGSGGEAHVLYGPVLEASTLSAASSSVIVVEGEGDGLGQAAAAARGGLLLQAAGADGAGVVYVFRYFVPEGSATVADADLSFQGAAAGDGLGASLSLVESGGFLGVLLAAPGADEGGDSAGALYLFEDLGL